MDNEQKVFCCWDKEACIPLLELPLAVWACVWLCGWGRRVKKCERIVREEEKRRIMNTNSTSSCGKSLQMMDAMYGPFWAASSIFFFNVIAVTQMYYSWFEQRYQRNSVEGLRERPFLRKINRWEGNLMSSLAWGKEGKWLSERKEFSQLVCLIWKKVSSSENAHIGRWSKGHLNAVQFSTEVSIRTRNLSF